VMIDTTVVRCWPATSVTARATELSAIARA
jgi:hypothetical protein